jgi:diacylglycerol kinase family enzyme
VPRDDEVYTVVGKGQLAVHVVHRHQDVAGAVILVVQVEQAKLLLSVLPDASVGIDARIGTDVHKYSKIPLIGGATGYITSLVVNVIKGLGQEMKIEAGNVKAEGKYSMVTCCNGNFYGGGFNPIKDANPADGQMNVLLTKNISRLQAAGLIGAYGDGRYYEVPDVITRVDTNKVHVKLDKVSVINIDGEAIYTDDLTVELIPGAVNFIVPEGMTYFDKKPE